MPDTENWPDIAGRLEEGCHILPLRVYFEDTDFSGVVYHASYLRFCERGRSDFMRLIGIYHNELFKAGENHSDGLAFAVRHMEIDFLAPAKIDDILLVKSSVRAMSGVRLTLEQNIARGDKHLLKMIVTIVLLNEIGEVKRFPKTLLTDLGKFMT